MAKNKTPRKLVASCSIEDFQKFLETGEIADVIWVEPACAGEDGVLEWVIQIHVPFAHFDASQLEADPMVADELDDLASWTESIALIGQCAYRAPISLKSSDIKVYQYDFCGDLHRLKNWQPHEWLSA